MHASEVAATANQNLERPYRPERNERNETIVLANHSRLLPLFQPNVVAEKTSRMRSQVSILGNQLL